MKMIITTIIFLMLGPATSFTEPPPPFEVHEWGTFTTVHASDGRLMAGLEIEEEILPSFVYSHAGLEPDRLTAPATTYARKGFFRPLHNVTVKMETPVLYFYSERAMKASVSVGFQGGSISQWYPQRSNGETVPVGAIDFAQPFTGSIKWDVQILAHDDTRAYTPQPSWQPTHWPIARVPAANKVMGEKGEVEHFLFYRGVGNFEIPLHITADEQSGLTLTNRGDTPIPYIMIYGRLHYGISKVWWQGPIPAGGTVSIDAPADREGGMDLTGIFNAFRPELVKAGLTSAEADAMLHTWEESYFMREGLRVFWIAPRSYTDQILPLQITPVPDNLERVIVGRSEVLLPAFEEILLREYRRNRLAAFAGDRYRKAYAQRAKALGKSSSNAPANAK